MSDTETILKNESGVKCAEGGSRGYLGLGTLILTNLRLVYINKQGKGATAAIELTAPLLAQHAIEKKAGNADLDDVAKFLGSFSIPIEGITRAEDVRHFLAAYLRVDSQSPSLKPVHNFFFYANASSRDWANAINSAMIARSPQTYAQPTTLTQSPLPPPPPPSAYAVPLCPSCGSPLTYIQQYQRWYCYKEKKYM